MIAQINEQQAAMVALAVHPARKPRGGAGIGSAERAAMMGTVGMHGENSS
jgi:hypothetical protein